MRLRSWLRASLSSLRPVLANFRVRPRAVAFFASLWLVWSGWSAWSPRGAKVALGLILLHILLRTSPDNPKPQSPPK